jgi:DNA polymerase III alpha subunit
MAFVGIEDKTSEGEIIVFPNLFEEVGSKLAQDVVIRVNGKVSTTDRDGNQTGEVKIIADEIVVVTDDELNSYQATGKKMKALKAKKPSAAKAAVVSASKEQVIYRPIDDRDPQKLYVHVKDPNDHDRLLKLKQSLNDFPGESEIILVLGDSKSSAMRLPFKVDPTEALRATIGELYGAECVALK